MKPTHEAPTEPNAVHYCDGTCIPRPGERVDISLLVDDAHNVTSPHTLRFIGHLYLCEKCGAAVSVTDPNPPPLPAAVRCINEGNE